MFNLFKNKEVQETKDTNEVENFVDVGEIASYIKEHIGIDFKDKKSILKVRTSSICRKHHKYNFDSCLDKLKNDDAFREEFINYLTTNESFFYREKHQIFSLVKKVSSAPNNVEILCAPSATGEEPYSIALALLEANVSKDKFKITGIDISTDAIQKSIDGEYNINSVRNLSQNILDKYFTKEDAIYCINKEIKQQVNFICVNLFDEKFSTIGKFDYIFSRNMFIYFDKLTKIKAKEILIKRLKNKDEDIFFGHADFPDN